MHSRRRSAFLNPMELSRVVARSTSNENWTWKKGIVTKRDRERKIGLSKKRSGNVVGKSGWKKGCGKLGKQARWRERKEKHRPLSRERRPFPSISPSLSLSSSCSLSRLSNNIRWAIRNGGQPFRISRQSSEKTVWSPCPFMWGATKSSLLSHTLLFQRLPSLARSTSSPSFFPTSVPKNREKAEVETLPRRKKLRGLLHQEAFPWRIPSVSLAGPWRHFFPKKAKVEGL